ncbi:hypothetical protein FO499_17300 [Bacillus anthracis]|uniref:hypothetical protein n=1 Tax=Bacillus anthracis TaxID=1392 RepID=UPI0005DCBF85|nr:hypothetical protein [Bacillus anthracis]COF28644.1 Uncharacterised protein [Streptococcus pneumoniae]MDR4408212.1 hypothetical protein [Bacillus anthracis]COQ38734.1 Uncharacterised protein [Streptococcus pneumoniae]COR41835.1 Uncharacterised protein [Streptococcus pneumoniae]CRG02007.1 Uncharacterised protein [Streptococcus pneumoniae]
MQAFIVNEKGLVVSRHLMPLDELNGFAKNAQDAIKQGWVLYNGEIPSDKIEGNRIGRVYYNKQENSFYYEWEVIQVDDSNADALIVLKKQQELMQQALDEIIINSPDKEELKALNEQQALMQKALDELIIASI